VIWKVLLSGIFAVMLSGVAPLSSQQLSQELEIHHSVSQTAIFPGDRIIYSIEIRCDPNVDILIGDLDLGRLNLTGLEALSSNLQRQVTDSGITYRVSYLLTTYSPGSSQLLIGEQSIRYHTQRPGARADTAAPERDVVVPATPIALRSTLPAEPSSLHIRDIVALSTASANTGWIMYVGLGLILFSGLPVALWGVPLLRQHLATLQQSRIPEPEIMSPTVMDTLRHIDTGSEIARREGYDTLETLIREQLAHTLGPLAWSLTATEAANRMPTEVTGVSSKEIIAVLADCEQARYGKTESLPAAARFQTGVDMVDGLYSAR
jgi:hypothetical protein